MIRLLRYRQARLASSRVPTGLKAASAATRCAPSIANTLELSSWMVRRASSSPQSKPKAALKATFESETKKPKAVVAPRLIIYHAGTPRIMFLGGLKITTVFVFGFFSVVTIPSFVQADAPIWQTAGLVVASVIPMLAVWYMTSPMVMWIHIPIPKRCLNDPEELQRFIKAVPSTTELAITTMGPLGKARVSKLPLKDIHREKRRLGLVNYVRDATRENAERRWYQFRAVSQFRIEDGLVYDKKTRAPWMWYTIQNAFKNKLGVPADRRSQGKRLMK